MTALVENGRMNIAIIYDNKLEYCPPLVTIARAIASYGDNVFVICNEADNSLKKLLGSEDIAVVEMRLKMPTATGKWYSDLRGFRRLPSMIESNIYKKNKHDRLKEILTQRAVDILWVACDSRKYFFEDLYLRYPLILQFFELYDYFPAENKIMKLAKHAKRVVVPEYCRAHICASALSLAEIPEILVNKPFSKPLKKMLPISDKKTSELIGLAKEKKILLYQGNITSERCPLQLAEASLEFADEYVLVLFGRTFDGQLNKLLQINPQIVHIPHLPAPAHLEVTSYAHIGLAYYSSHSLNYVFCAPNKIYEYSGFGIPVLARDIPGLRYTIGIAGAGLCVEWNTADKIVSGIKHIEQNYDDMSTSATRFFNATDNNLTIKNILSKVKDSGSRQMS